MKETTGQDSTATASRPTFDVVEAFYWQAFQTLQASRTMGGFGPGSIPLTEMLAYADLMELSREDRREFVQILRTMDRAYLEQVSKT